MLRPAGLEPARVTFLQLTEAILEMIKAGMGVSVLPTWSIAPSIGTGAVKAVRVTRSGVYRQWSAATLAAAEPSAFEDYFIQMLTREGKTLGRPTARSA